MKINAALPEFDFICIIDGVGGVVKEWLAKLRETGGWLWPDESDVWCGGNSGRVEKRERFVKQCEVLEFEIDR